MKNPSKIAAGSILPVIVVSQFLCTSLWFAGNAVMTDIIRHSHLPQDFLSYLTSAVQFGFVCGTLVFAIFTLSDRYAPSKVFFISSIVAGLFNLGMVFSGLSASTLLLLRFFTGFFLAGIYPVGMKIASDYYQKGLGKSLGFLVGALVLGTAFPHFIKSITATPEWSNVMVATTLLSAAGGLMMRLLVPDGPFRKKNPEFRLTAFLSGFKNKKFRAASIGYFGHMWELYTFWAFVPVMLNRYSEYYHLAGFHTSLYSFLIIGSGGLACVCSGYISQYAGAKRTATFALLLSGICCLLSPFFLLHHSVAVFLFFLFFWGLVVIADSPLFSSLVAQNAPDDTRGTSLTIVNCIGFSITILSIQFLNFLSGKMNAEYLYVILAAGPITGLIFLLNKKMRLDRTS